MLELLGGGVVGGLIGGLFRLAPEVLKFFDKNSERAHELAMFDRQCQLEMQRGSQRLAEIGAAVDHAALETFTAAIQQQSEMTTAAGGWVAKVSASVRPVITYWILFLWSFANLWFAWSAWRSGVSPTDVFKTMMSADFMALVSGTVNYWFLDRTLAKRGLA